MREGPVAHMARNLERAGIITSAEAERLRELERLEEDREQQRLMESNKCAGAAYDALPRWRKLTAGPRSNWISKHRDYWPL